MGVIENGKKPGDESKASTKQQALGGKNGHLQIRRGRYYDDQGRENTVKDGDLEIQISAYNTLRTTTDKTGFDPTMGS